MKESELYNKIIKTLLLRGWVVWRNNVGASYIHGNYMRFSIEGSPDIIGFTWKGQFVGIEVKKEDGELAKSQIEFRDRMIKAGCLYLLLTKLEDLEGIWNK